MTEIKLTIARQAEGWWLMFETVEPAPAGDEPDITRPAGPIISIPCVSYEHAMQVKVAYEREGK